MVKVLGIYGSPRRDGNSDILLNSILSGAETGGAVVERIFVRDLRIAPCNSCGGCWKEGDCVIRDDMQQLYGKLVAADIIAVSSPIYFMGVSAQLKAFIDRCQAFWARKYVLNFPIREGGKVARGFFLSSAARMGDEGLFTGAVKTIKAFFHVVDTKYIGDILCPGLEEKGSVNQRQELLRKAFDTGRHLFVP